MITNILLGLILGIVISSSIISYNKFNDIISDVKFIKEYLNAIDKTICNSNKLISHLLDKFNDFALRYHELNGLLETKVNHNTEYFNKQIVKISENIEELYNNNIVQHNATRNEIKKQAKISSKKKSQSKTSKPINK